MEICGIFFVFAMGIDRYPCIIHRMAGEIYDYPRRSHVFPHDVAELAQDIHNLLVSFIGFTMRVVSLFFIG